MGIKERLIAGFAKEEITPAIPVSMSGYKGTRTATGIHDPLYAHVLVIKKGENLFVLTVLDLLSVDVELVASIRSKAESLGIKGHHVQILATHTHSGPTGMNDTKRGIMKGNQYFLVHKSDSYIQEVSEKIIKAIQMAIENLQPQSLTIGKTTVSGISSNRSRKSDKYDDVLLALEFCSATNEKNLWVRFSCHPTVYNSSNTFISADFPAALYRQYANQYQHILFMNGACGDISTRYTRKTADFKEIERIGHVLEEAVTHSLKEPVYKGALDFFHMYSKTFNIQTKTPGNTKELEENYHLAKEGIEKTSLQAEIAYAKHQKQQMVSLEVGAIDIQGFILLFLPVEIYSSLVLGQLNEDIFFSGFANGYYTYLPDTKAYEKGEYEAHMSPFAIGEGERMIEQITRWAQGFKKKGE